MTAARRRLNPPLPKRWAVCRKGYWKAIVVYYNKEQADRAIEGHEETLEVREVID